jgi:Mg/Co/Ni transporter MgtE
MDLIVNLLTQVSSFISQENKKNEVDELTENIVLLYKKEVIDKNESQLIEGITINELIDKLAHSKTKSFPSLTSKSIFKYMDMFEYAF